MPRTARIKNNESINYIIVKGTPDIPLFREEEDKQEYLSLISKFKSIQGVLTALQVFFIWDLSLLKKMKITA